MKPPLTPFITLVLLILAVTLVTGAVWYRSDRTGMLGAMCEAGLPNLSRPSIVEQDQLGCAILGAKGTYEGILVTGFEASNFRSSGFRPVDGVTASMDVRAWFNCPPAGCGAPLERQLDQKLLGECNSEDFHSGMASVTAVGWVTETPGHYGHLGQYPREFYAEKIAEVSPPPIQFVRDRIAGLKLLEVCS